jgi:ComF family protein
MAPNSFGDMPSDCLVILPPMTALATLGRAALDLLYPPRCALCGRGGTLLCDACLGQLPKAIGARCDVCWLPLRDGRACRTCAEHPVMLERLRSAFRYEGDVRRLVHAFKFGGQSSLGPSLAGPLIAAYETQGLDAEVIVPVPLTGLGGRLRGYNQAALLARELSEAVGIPCVQALARRRSVRQQARSSSAEERRLNVVGAFAVRLPEAVAGKRVLLIDDVATTGATLDACARALLQAGASSISGLTLARED